MPAITGERQHGDHGKALLQPMFLALDIGPTPGAAVGHLELGEGGHAGAGRTGEGNLIQDAVKNGEIIIHLKSRHPVFRVP